MKDLKHLMYFEELLQNQDNELIKQAQADGQLAVGYTCYYMPEVLLNVGNCFSTRLRAPNTGSIDIATYYMSNYTCEFARSLLERAIEGGYEYLDVLAEVDACSAMNRAAEHIEVLNCNTKEKFFCTHLDVPYKVEDYSVEHMAIQVRLRLLDEFKNVYGVDTSDDAIRAAVKEHNELCDVITELSEMRKLENPPITGYEYALCTWVSYVCPTALILPYLKETLAEVKKRKLDPKPWYRARVAVVGSEIDDPELIQLIEQCGAFVVADRYCYGTFPGRERIELNDDEDLVYQICRHYMETSLCARYMSEEKIQQRRDRADELAKEFGADGIIYEQMKFCDFWAFERPLASHILTEEYGWPTLSIDRPYRSRNSGQLRTRFQAFVEALEIKRIQTEKEGA
ncbi:MAG: 2-hydroxyacyl-CoA dehydratase [Clostridia bacterium]|nr:2-hydroxyacyl-CoA dehydratase [Clostridia bacterium]